MLVVNIPVADIERSKAFFARLGFSYHPMFTGETAACMLVGEQACVMLLSRERFAQFAMLPMADPTTHTLALHCFSVSARNEVDTVAEAALAAGGTEADGPEDHGFMYSRSFSTSTAMAGRSYGWTQRRRSRPPGSSRPPCRTPTPRPDPSPRSPVCPLIHPIRQGDEFSFRRKSIPKEGTTVVTVRHGEARRGCAGWPSFPAPPIHDAALEATMDPAICSCHTSGAGIAAVLV
jgi:predicted lactoylglutathione lyase